MLPPKLNKDHVHQASVIGSIFVHAGRIRAMAKEGNANARSSGSHVVYRFEPNNSLG